MRAVTSSELPVTSRIGADELPQKYRQDVGAEHAVAGAAAMCRTNVTASFMHGRTQHSACGSYADTEQCVKAV